MPSKPKTIKPVMAWGMTHGNGNLSSYTRADRSRMAGYAKSLGGKVTRVEIRDAATAKLRDAVIEAAIAYTLHISSTGTGATPEQRIAEVGRRKRLWDDMHSAVGALQSKKVRK